ncbi:DNA-formamidopyrimidine glycosylase family protein [Streptomyces sp. NPDC048636]|uniref:Fpg/Nei family DNA glycosylase n=1 Tax=Streptomyces sp. NPDC048636 TaxID=3155762 RepID=UPI003444F0EF
MPELPDVEGFRRTLASCAQGRRVAHVEVSDAGVLHGVTPGRLRRELEGRRFAAPRRHGKWLIAPTDGPALLLHFGMTGRLVCAEDGAPPGRFERVALTLDDGHRLGYEDQRKLRGIWLAATDADTDRVLGPQGPDALTLDRPGLDARLADRRGSVKATLIDQSVVAGLGNLLGDEILWRARIHPRHRAGALDPDARRRLHTAMRQVLRTSVRVGEVPARSGWLTGHRDDPDPHCPRCGRPLRRGRIAGRTSTWCPHCQPDGG